MPQRVFITMTAKGRYFFMKGPLSGICIKLRHSPFHYVVTPPLCLLMDWTRFVNVCVPYVKIKLWPSCHSQQKNVSIL